MFTICLPRDYQYQWIYHLIQSGARRQGKSQCFYGGMQFTEPKFRVGKTAFALVHHALDNLQTRPEYYVGSLVNLPKF